VAKTVLPFCSPVKAELFGLPALFRFPVDGGLACGLRFDSCFSSVRQTWEKGELWPTHTVFPLRSPIGARTVVVSWRCCGRWCTGVNIDQ